MRSSWALAAAVLLTCSAPVAVAQAEEPGCEYRLSAPYVVDVSGTPMVTATLTTGACEASNTYLTVACVQVQGSPTAGLCRQNNGPLTAQVYYGALQPGATYVSTGRGCWTSGNPPQPTCAPVGPFTATL